MVQFTVKNLSGYVCSNKGDIIIFLTLQDSNDNRYIKICLNFVEHDDMIFTENGMPHHICIIYHFCKAKSYIDIWKGVNYLKGAHILQKCNVSLTLGDIDDNIIGRVHDDIYDNKTLNNLSHEQDMFFLDMYDSMMDAKLDYETSVMTKPKLTGLFFHEFPFIKD